MTRRMWGALAVPILTVLAFEVLFGLAKLAAAHSYVAESYPADRERLPASPEEIRVVFTEPIETGISRLRLIDPFGREVTGTHQYPVGERELRLTLTDPLEPGDYRIKWKILAKDSHVIDGTIPFTVDAASTGEDREDATEAELSQPTEDKRSQPAKSEPPQSTQISRPAAVPPRIGTAEQTSAQGLSSAVVGLLVAGGICVAGLSFWWWKRWKP